MKQRFCPGVTIIECIVYIALSAVLSMMLFYWWALSQQQIKALENTVQQAIGERLIYLLVSRDLAQASPQISDWQVTQERFSFSSHQGTVSYRTNKGTLYPSKGNLYRVLKKKGALRSNKAVIARHVIDMNVALKTQGDLIQAITLSIAFEKDKKVIWQIPLRRGMRS